jgi:ATP/maltotriose-dependent transcriptional regulator MalT
MRDFDSDVLRAATQLSVLSGRVVRLLETLDQQVAIESDATAASADLRRIIYADLQIARQLQKALVEGHFALVRSMLRKQRREWRIAVAGSVDLGVSLDHARLAKERSVPNEAGPVQTHGKPVPSGQSFTERQRQIIHLVSLGYDNRQIGQSLCIAQQTVKNHLHAIFEKAGVSRRIDLAMHAFDTDDADSKTLLAGDVPANRAHAEQQARRASGS